MKNIIKGVKSVKLLNVNLLNKLNVMDLNVMEMLWPYYLLFYKNDWLKNS